MELNPKLELIKESSFWDEMKKYTLVEKIGSVLAKDLNNGLSLTLRLFTDKEDACNHCNCGNVKLTFDTFMNWIMQMKEEGR